MSEKVRIYQLAKDLGIESKDLITALVDMGVDAKTASSSIDAETADMVKQLLEDSQEETSKPAESAT
ncbi:MAG: translation initiation factor IF-2 N-terminal domain-containing protein, partial [Trueperaceae bacterium]|nr:translation initiation factor IF-2 N-terminal domain-containing protein [Trueperaceae bacterium]